MKKGSLIITLCVLAAVAISAPITVTYQTAGPVPALYLDEEFLNPVPSGYYAELIIMNTDTYVHSQFWAYEVLGTIGYGTGPYDQNYALVGTTAAGTTTAGDGHIGLKWLNTSYNTDYYIALRFYDAANKDDATYYGVAGIYKLTKSGSTEGAPDWEIKTFVTKTTNNNNRYWTQYEMFPIPEPSTLALVGLGGLALVLRRRMKK